MGYTWPGAAGDAGRGHPRRCGGGRGRGRQRHRGRRLRAHLLGAAGRRLLPAHGERDEHGGRPAELPRRRGWLPARAARTGPPRSAARPHGRARGAGGRRPGDHHAGAGVRVGRPAAPARRLCPPRAAAMVDEPARRPRRRQPRPDAAPARPVRLGGIRRLLRRGLRGAAARGARAHAARRPAAPERVEGRSLAADRRRCGGRLRALRPVAWLPALLMLPASYVGGHAGVMFARRVHPDALRSLPLGAVVLDEGAQHSTASS